MSQSPPWARIREPIPFPPTLTADTLLGLDDSTFARLVRDHQLPRDQPGRHAWSRLWAILAAEDQLAERAHTVLDELADQTDEALAAGLDEAQQKRARKFLLLCEQSIDRIAEPPPEDEPLAWAGRRVLRFTPASRRVIDDLVQAIDRHRRDTRTLGPDEEQDRRLWAVLDSVGLNPETFRSKNRVD